MTKKNGNQPIFVPIDWEGSKQNPPEYPELPSIPISADILLKAVADAFGSGMNGMMKEGIESFQDFRKGKIDEKQYTYRVVYKGTQAAVKGGSRTAAALGLSEGAKRLIVKKFGEEALRRLGKYNFVTSMAFGIIDQGTHTYQYANGQLPARDFKIKSVENVGGTGGAISGAAAGAMIGSAFPGLGTVAGAMLGYAFAVMGAMSGASLGKSLGEQWFPDPSAEATEKNSEESTSSDQE
ncbi:MAG: hypothetical protein AAF587_20120 [Bacteroidota bacterium]